MNLQNYGTQYQHYGKKYKQTKNINITWVN